MGALTENFDSYSDGDLNGQGSWSGGTDFDIQGTITQGSSAKAAANTAAASSSISKSFTDAATGIQSLYGYVTNVSTEARWSVRLGEGASPMVYVKNFSGQLQYFNGATYVNLGAISNSTWFQLEVEWDASTDQARYRLNGGSWTSYANCASTWTNMNKVFLVVDTASAGSTYWDTFADGAAASGPANLKSLDTNLKENIKSYNTNLIANIKSINTNA